MKNIVLCLDGTANEFARDRTNVVKLYSALVQDPARQVSYYHPGLGTMEPVGALTPWARGVTRACGLAFGYGLFNDIRDAYVFLMNSFEPGDHVFLFGFSRGAYTARAVASLLHMYGLIDRGNEPLVPYAIRMLAAVQKGKDAAGNRPAFDLAQDFKTTFCTRACSPWFVGVWDTVSSVGWIENALHLPYTGSNPDIAYGRHAVAIDERRAFFRTNLWRPSANNGGPRNLKQVWFPGVHCDVGGGYPEGESGLSSGALNWMLDEATSGEVGLLVDLGKRQDLRGAPGKFASPDAKALAHESLNGWWWLAEILFKKHFNWTRMVWERRMNLGRKRTIPPGSLVHSSAYERGHDYAKRLPADVTRVS